MTKNEKLNSKASEDKNACLSVKSPLHKKYTEFLQSVNTLQPELIKELKKVTMSDLLEILSENLNDKLKDKLLTKRITGQAKERLYRKRYESCNGNISDDDWLEVIMSPDFQRFKKENKDCIDIV